MTGTEQYTREASDAAASIDISRIPGSSDPVSTTLSVLSGIEAVGCAAWFTGGNSGDATVVGVVPSLLPGAPIPPWLVEIAQAEQRVENGWAALRLDRHGDRTAYAISRHVSGRVSTIVLLGDGELDAETLGYAKAAALLGIGAFDSGNEQRASRDDELQSGLARVLGAFNESKDPRVGFRAVCDTMAMEYECDRVSLVALDSGRAELLAASNAEKIAKNASLVRQITDAAEECADQDAAIAYPGVDDGRHITRAARDLASSHGTRSGVLAVPVRVDADVLGVVVLERFSGPQFSDEEIREAGLVGDLVSRRFEQQVLRSRALPVRMAAGARLGLAKLLSPTHTWMKLALILVGAFLVASMVIPIQDHAASGGEIVATQSRSVSAPFAGFIVEGKVRVGDRVTAGESVIARMDTSLLEVELAEARAQQRSHQTDAANFRDQGQAARAAIAGARADQVQATIDLLEYKVASATIISPISGVVTQGDAFQMSGASVALGQSIARIADPASISLRLEIPESEMGGVEVGARGVLITPAAPARPLDFEVAEVSDLVVDREGVRVLVAEGELVASPEWLVPGMSGDARIDTVRRAALFVWTRRLTDWVRLKLWI